MKTLKQKFEGNTDQEGMIWIDDTLRVVKEWLQQKHGLETFNDDYTEVEDELLSKKELLEELE